MEHKPMYSKVKAGGVAGAIVLIMVWIAAEFFELTIPPDIASAMTLVISFAAGYLKTELVGRQEEDALDV